MAKKTLLYGQCHLRPLGIIFVLSHSMPKFEILMASTLEVEEQFYGVHY